MRESTLPTEAVEVPIEHLEAQIGELSAHLDAAGGRLLVLLAAFDEREGLGCNGIVSCAHWLSWRYGYSLGAADEHVVIACDFRSPLQQVQHEGLTVEPQKGTNLYELGRHSPGTRACGPSAS